MSDILQTALDLTTRGYAIHWLRGKQPVSGKWSSQPPATAESGCGIGAEHPRQGRMSQGRSRWRAWSSWRASEGAGLAV